MLIYIVLWKPLILVVTRRELSILMSLRQSYQPTLPPAGFVSGCRYLDSRWLTKSFSLRFWLRLDETLRGETRRQACSRMYVHISHLPITDWWCSQIDNEFTQLIKGYQGERLRQAFHYFDADGDGYINPEEFQRIIVEIAGHKLSDAVLGRLPTLCTMNPGRRISYSEVIAFHNSKSDHFCWFVNLMDFIIIIF